MLESVFVYGIWQLGTRTWDLKNHTRAFLVVQDQHLYAPNAGVWVELESTRDPVDPHMLQLMIPHARTKMWQSNKYISIRKNK